MTTTSAETELAPPGNERGPYARHIEFVDTGLEPGGPPVNIPDRFLIDGIDVSHCVGYMPQDRWPAWEIRSLQEEPGPDGQRTIPVAAVGLAFLPHRLRVTPLADNPKLATVELLHDSGVINLMTTWGPGVSRESGTFTEFLPEEDYRPQGGNGPMTRERVWIFFERVTFRGVTDEDSRTWFTPRQAVKRQ